VRRYLTRLAVLAWALSAAPDLLAAQSSDTLFATGVRAYKNLEFDLAALLLRREVAQLTTAGAPVAERTQALVYLGAADLFRGRRDSAAVVFRRLVTLDPRYRPDRLVFPPEVTSLFDGVRLQTKTVMVEVPRDTTLGPGHGTFDIWLIASSFQTVDVTLRYTDGAPFRPLYAGPIGDSAKVQWDGNGPSVELSITQGKKVIAKVPAHIVNLEVPSQSDAAVVKNNGDGTKSLSEVRLSGKKFSLSVGEEAAKADATR